MPRRVTQGGAWLCLLKSSCRRLVECLVNEPQGEQKKVRIGPLGKEGDKLIRTIKAGNMVAILSKGEIMYTFIYRKQYQCFIHPIGSNEGRHKSWDMDERNTAMIKNLTSVADQLFEVEFEPDMDFMGVMVAAEQGIVNFLNSVGQLPADDYDFMEFQDEVEGG